MSTWPRVQSGRWTLLLLTAAAAAVGLGCGVLVHLSRGRRRRQRREDRRRRLLRDLTRLADVEREHEEADGEGVRVFLVQDLEQWQQTKDVLSASLAASSPSRMVGFDLEWVTRKGQGAGPIAVMQIATPDKKCFLIRPKRLLVDGKLPPDLQQLLEDAAVLKLGVGITEDSAKCLNDLGACVRGCVDLRHLLQFLDPEARRSIRRTGLAGLTKTFLGLDLDKDWRVRAGDWECLLLTARQMNYAANDALCGIHVALGMALEQEVNDVTQPDEPEWDDLKAVSDLIERLYQKCRPFSDLAYKAKPPKPGNPSSAKSEKGRWTKGNNRSSASPEKVNKALSIRKKPLYHNARLEAPDGQQLCVCDIKKADWYVAKGLGERVSDDPVIVRLRFEPSGRPEGEAGEYYLVEKENICVVCGKGDSYLRKYVVPHEYRKFFPEIMRDHSSHDILLMCQGCHTRSNLLDLSLRNALAEECNAPIGTEDDVKVREDRELKTIRSFARGLIKDREWKKIPAARKDEMRAALMDYFQVKEISDELLKKASNLDPMLFNTNYCPHGQKVVNHFIANDGILALERKWRQHFLDTMRPKYLPPLWSVNHQQERLKYKASINGITDEDIRLANGNK